MVKTTFLYLVCFAGSCIQAAAARPLPLHSGDSSANQQKGSSFDPYSQRTAYFTLNVIDPINPQLVVGPYLNLTTQTSIIIRWRTDTATTSKVLYGTMASNLNLFLIDTTFTKDHVVRLTGLAQNTRYFYSIGSIVKTLQGDSSNYFRTLPAAGTIQPVRALVMGDMGYMNGLQRDVKNAYLKYNGSNYTDAWILLGDNAYNKGLDSEYRKNFFVPYQSDLTKNHVIWPAPGNHDYANSAARQADHNVAYYALFTVPTKGEAGGVPSISSSYYSYDIGNVHFVSLDSYGWEDGGTRLYDTAGVQVSWLKQDLAANRQKWTVVYFHHPPYSKGSHNSDLEVELVNLRQQLVPVLERYKVDLVLSGHSHSYERSLPIAGHYGAENTFDSATMALSTSSGRDNGEPNSCMYIKRSSDTMNAILYAVVGSSSRYTTISPGYPHNAMQYSNVQNVGVLVLDIEENRLHGEWLCSDGLIRDSFTMLKDAGKKSIVNIDSGASVTLTASWKGTYRWLNGTTGRSLKVTPQNDTEYMVTDAHGCVTDTFTVQLKKPGPGPGPVPPDPQDSTTTGTTNSRLLLYPNPSASEFVLNVPSQVSGKVSFFLTDIYGHRQQIVRESEERQFRFGRTLPPGTYVLQVQAGGELITRKLIKLRH